MGTKTKKILQAIWLYFDNWVCFGLGILCLSLPYWISNIEPNGPMPRSNWWWLVGAAVLILISRGVQLYQISKRTKQEWRCPEVTPFSNPIRMVNGMSVPFEQWWICMSGEPKEKIHTLILLNGYEKQVAMKKYQVYLSDFNEMYGTEYQ